MQSRDDTTPPSLDHLVGAREQRGRQVEAERLRGCLVDYQLVLSYGIAVRTIRF